MLIVFQNAAEEQTIGRLINEAQAARLPYDVSVRLMSGAEIPIYRANGQAPASATVPAIVSAANQQTAIVVPINGDDNPPDMRQQYGAISTAVAPVRAARRESVRYHWNPRWTFEMFEAHAAKYDPAALAPNVRAAARVLFERGRDGVGLFNSDLTDACNPNHATMGPAEYQSAYHSMQSAVTTLRNMAGNKRIVRSDRDAPFRG